MIDLTSSLYLGLSHGSSQLRAWPQLTLGAPAALRAPPGEAEMAERLAALMGFERCLVMRSTLHAFFDLFSVLARPRVHVFVDAGAYAIGTWAATLAARSNGRVTPFRHRDAEALRAGLRRAAGRPVVVGDGFCPGCGRTAPVSDYLAATEPLAGLVVLDDTQALGVLGTRAGATSPYGRAGGGTPRWLGVSDPRLVVVASLAKGFGAPLAVVAATRDEVRHLESASATRVHCSPPSAADLRAAENALGINAKTGERRRATLLALIRRLRRALTRHSIALEASLFPIQSLRPVPGMMPLELHRQLLERGVATVVHQKRCRPGATLSLIVTAAHRPGQIDRAASAVARSAGERLRGVAS